MPESLQIIPIVSVSSITALIKKERITTTYTFNEKWKCCSPSCCLVDYVREETCSVLSFSYKGVKPAKGIFGGNFGGGTCSTSACISARNRKASELYAGNPYTINVSSYPTLVDMVRKRVDEYISKQDKCKNIQRCCEDWVPDTTSSPTPPNGTGQCSLVSKNLVPPPVSKPSNEEELELNIALGSGLQVGLPPVTITW